MISKRIVVFLLLLSAVLATEYVVVGSARVNIRTGPSTTHYIIGQAHKGDVYRVLARDGDWYEIELFSGDVRYIVAASYIYPLTEEQLDGRLGMELPEELELCHTIHASVKKGLERAELEAQEIIPVDENDVRHYQYLRIKQDEIILGMFRNFGLQTLVYPELMDLARDKGW